MCERLAVASVAGLWLSCGWLSCRSVCQCGLALLVLGAGVAGCQCALSVAGFTGWLLVWLALLLLVAAGWWRWLVGCAGIAQAGSVACGCRLLLIGRSVTRSLGRWLAGLLACHRSVARLVGWLVAAHLYVIT